jgi:N-formylglutamate amidohydrolase
MLPSLLISTPHSSAFVPERILARMLETSEPEAALRRRILRGGDPYTDAIFNLPDAVLVNATASRFVADLNRARDEGGDNGVIKLTDFDKYSFYAPDFKLTPEDREKSLTAYYDPYHQALENALHGGNIRFLIDGHSMTAYGPALGPDHHLPRPALCISNLCDSDDLTGNQPVSCPPELAHRIRDWSQDLFTEILAEPGMPKEVLLNHPFTGGHILRKYCDPDYPHRVPGVMVEVNRALYLDEATLLPDLDRVERLREAFERLGEKILGAF